MADRSKIEWTDRHDWNPIRGCTRVSEGCRNCYAEEIAARFSGPGKPFHNFAERTPKGPRWTGKIKLIEDRLTLPLTWRKPVKIFVNSASDLFHDAVPDEWLDRIFAVMALAPQHTFQILTKRSKRMREYVSDKHRAHKVAMSYRDMFNDGTIEARIVNSIRRDTWPFKSNDSATYDPDYIFVGKWPLPNVWLGVTAEDQPAADARIPDLLTTPAAVRFVSCEPMLGPMDLREIDISGDACITPLTAHSAEELTEEWGEPIAEGQPRLDWIITGGESGPHARPSHPDWFRSPRDQCAAAGVAYFHKQNGEWAPGEAIKDVQTRTEVGATWFAGKWMEERIIPKISESLHYDDEPDVWRVGKARAGRLLDGVEHSEFPGAPR